MANKQNFHLLISFSLLLMIFFTVPMFAQENYVIQEAEDGSVIFVQTLSWQAVQNILYYEAVIERNEESGFVEYQRLQTETNSIEVSLPPGEYRYKIIVYNLLEKIEVETDYLPFQIIQAIQPQVVETSPLIIYLEEINDGIYTVTGENLLEDTTYVLHNNTNQSNVSGELIGADEEEKINTIQFDMDMLEIGDYNLVATNPGGLKSESEPIIVKFKKMMDLDVAGGYVCPIIIRDDTIKNYLGSNVWPVSLLAKVTFIPIKRPFGYFGLGLTATYTRMYTLFDTYNLDGNLLTGHLNFVYQLPIIKQRLVLDVHGGVGAVFLNNFQFKFQESLESTVLNSILISVDAGASIQFYILKRLYLEAGADYIMPFMTDMAMDMIHPSILVGWQF